MTTPTAPPHGAPGAPADGAAGSSGTPPRSTAPQPPQGMPTRTDRFFEWTRGFGILRHEPWLGGVCAGIAARLRVDPLIIRGIVVVVAVLGLPALALYAVAWALLPDTKGDIPLQSALRRRFEPSMIVIAVLLVVGVIPVVPWIVLGMLPYGFLLGSGSFGTALTVFTLVVAGTAIAFLVWRAGTRTTPPRASAPPRTASAGPAFARDTVGEAGAAPGSPAAFSAGENGVVTRPAGPDDDATAVASAADTTLDADADPLAPPTDPALRTLPALPEAPPSDGPEPTPATLAAPEPAPAEAPRPETASDDAIEAWRAQHAAWKEQDQAWRRQQQDADRLARQQARQEREERAAVFAAEAADRRRERRATRPRTPFAYAAAVIGIAVLVGTGAALQRTDALAPATGLFVAALVLGLGMVVAGVVRRRSGFLAFTTILALFGGVAAAAVPAADALHLGGYGISNRMAQTYPATAPFLQPWGDLSVYLDDTGRDGELHVQKRSGWTSVWVEPGVRLELEFTTRDGYAEVRESDATGASGPGTSLGDLPGVAREVLGDGRVRYRTVLGPADPDAVTTRQRLVIDQESGYLDLDISTAAADPTSSREGEAP